MRFRQWISAGGEALQTKTKIKEEKPKAVELKKPAEKSVEIKEK